MHSFGFTPRWIIGRNIAGIGKGLYNTYEAGVYFEMILDKIRLNTNITAAIFMFELV